MFVRDPEMELQLFRLREKELHEAAARDRLVRSAARPGDGFGRRLLLGFGGFLVALGEKIRGGLEEPTENAAA